MAGMKVLLIYLFDIMLYGTFIVQNHNTVSNATTHHGRNQNFIVGVFIVLDKVVINSCQNGIGQSALNL